MSLLYLVDKSEASDLESYEFPNKIMLEPGQRGAVDLENKKIPISQRLLFQNEAKKEDGTIYGLYIDALGKRYWINNGIANYSALRSCGYTQAILF